MNPHKRQIQRVYEESINTYFGITLQSLLDKVTELHKTYGPDATIDFGTAQGYYEESYASFELCSTETNEEFMERMEVARKYYADHVKNNKENK